MKNKYLKLCVFVFSFILILSMQVFAQDAISVYVNNQQVSFDQQPFIENDRTLVPFRAIFEALEADVEWNGETNTVTGTKGDTIVRLSIGSAEAYVNDSKVILDVPAKITNSRTMVPLRFIAESMNSNVEWQGKTKSVYITDGDNKAKRNLSVHFIDVGQADSILAMLPNGENMLIDAGNNADGDLVTNYIKNQGINKIDYLIGTHPHEDHIGGLDNVINTFNIGKIYMPKVSSNTKTFEDVLNAISNKGLTVNTAKANVNIYNANGLKIDILAPCSDSYDDLNDYSAVVKLTYLNKSFLFMGDAEKISENQILEDLDSDLIKIGHHGSSSSTSQEFINKVLPSSAVISVGQDNTYGHPHSETLALLKNSGIAVYRTDEVGTIIATSDGNSINIDKNASVININAPPLDNTTNTYNHDANNNTITSNNIANDTKVYVTKTGKKYHRDGCSSLSKSKIEISLEEAKNGYEPCGKCNPPR